MHCTEMVKRIKNPIVDLKKSSHGVHHNLEMAAFGCECKKNNFKQIIIGGRGSCLKDTIA